VNFNPTAEQALAWTSAQVDAPVPTAEAALRLGFLATRPQRHVEGDLLFVHGSARDPVHEYVFPDDVYDPDKMRNIFDRVPRWCFQGHTHMAGVFTEALEFRSQAELGEVYRLGAGKAMVNVGSVGQPRDGDWRACYALLDGEVVRFRRVEYDVDQTVRKMHADPGLPASLGDRLRRGA
jgi:diadenosine tetraphosphatase ApaH/serine/threonine PP2A family protein phosphatase